MFPGFSNVLVKIKIKNHNLYAEYGYQSPAHVSNVFFFFFESVRMSCFGKQLTSTQSNLKVMTAV